jgi:hypothetical protein
MLHYHRRSFTVGFTLVTLMAIVSLAKLFIVVYVPFAGFSFPCSSPHFENDRCSDLSFYVNITSTFNEPCESECIQTINCRNLCQRQAPLEVYFLLVTFPLALFYVCFMSYEMTATHELRGRAIQSLNTREYESIETDFDEYVLCACVCVLASDSMPSTINVYSHHIFVLSYATHQQGTAWSWQFLSE